MRPHYPFNGSETIGQLAQELHEELHGAVLWNCFSTSPFDLIFQFISTQHKAFELKFTFQNGGVFLFFQPEHQVAKMKAMPQFQSWQHGVCMGVLQVINDRSFYFQFENHLPIWIRFYGPQGNAIGFHEDGNVVFRKNIKSDFLLTPDQLKIEHGFDQKIHLESKSFWEESQEKTFIWRKDGKIYKTFSNFILLYSEYGGVRLNESAFEKKKSELIAQARVQIKKMERFISNAEKKLSKMDQERSWEELGHLILSHLHEIKPDSKFIQVFDFYQNTEVVIPLKKDLNPQENAAFYYRKNKNRAIEKDILIRRIQQSKSELNQCLKGFVEIERAPDLKSLKKIQSPSEMQKEPSKPYYEIEFEGFQIRVGKNAKSNDLLTLKLSNKFDWWFHAHGYSGSHVVVKAKDKNPLPSSVIEKAAALAAYNSKGKNAGLLPVMVTQIRFVRKPKGADPGAVDVASFKIVDVVPRGS